MAELPVPDGGSSESPAKRSYDGQLRAQRPLPAATGDPSFGTASDLRAAIDREDKVPAIGIGNLASEPASREQAIGRATGSATGAVVYAARLGAKTAPVFTRGEEATVPPSAPQSDFSSPPAADGALLHEQKGGEEILSTPLEVNDHIAGEPLAQHLAGEEPEIVPSNAGKAASEPPVASEGYRDETQESSQTAAAGDGAKEPPSPKAPPGESGDREPNVTDYVTAAIVLGRLSLRQGVDIALLNRYRGLVEYPVESDERFSEEVARITRKACLTLPDFDRTLDVLHNLPGNELDVDRVIATVEKQRRTASARQHLAEFLALNEPGSERFVAAETLFLYELEKSTREQEILTEEAVDFPLPTEPNTQLSNILGEYEAAYGPAPADSEQASVESGDAPNRSTYVPSPEEALTIALDDLYDIERDHRHYVANPEVYGKDAGLYQDIFAYLKTQDASLIPEEDALKARLSGSYTESFSWRNKMRRRLLDFRRLIQEVQIRGHIEALDITNTSTPDLRISFSEYRGMQWNNPQTYVYVMHLVDPPTYAQSLSRRERLMHGGGGDNDRKYVLIYGGEAADTPILNEQRKMLNKMVASLG